MTKVKSVINDDGQLNITKIGLPNHYISDFYHHLMKMSWLKFFFFFILFYLSINCIFASLYYFTGDNILNATHNSYWEAWLFSFQTSSTLGYGYMLPKTTLGNIIVIFDALSGILFVALATGIAFTKLSRPTAKVMFSNNVLITPYNGKPTLLFRIGNKRSNEVIDANVRMIVLMNEFSREGITMRRLLDLKLERTHTPLFALSWTLMHVIDENSPLHGISQQDFKEQDISFTISFTGIDDVFSQTIHGRKIYSANQVVFNKKFEDMLIIDDRGDRVLDYSKFHLLKN